MITVLVILAILLALFAIIRAPSHADVLNETMKAPPQLSLSDGSPYAPKPSLLDTPITVVFDFEELDERTRDFSLREIVMGHESPTSVKRGTKFCIRWIPTPNSVAGYRSEEVILHHTTLGKLLTEVLDAQDLQFEDGQDAVESQFAVGPNTLQELTLSPDFAQQISDRLQGFKLI